MKTTPDGRANIRATLAAGNPIGDGLIVVLLDDIDALAAENARLLAVEAIMYSEPCRCSEPLTGYQCPKCRAARLAADAATLVGQGGQT